LYRANFYKVLTFSVIVSVVLWAYSEASEEEYCPILMVERNGPKWHWSDNSENAVAYFWRFAIKCPVKTAGLRSARSCFGPTQI